MNQGRGDRHSVPRNNVSKAAKAETYRSSRGCQQGHVSDKMGSDEGKAEESLPGRLNHQVTDFIHRQRGAMKSVEEGEARKCEGGKAVNEATVLPQASGEQSRLRARSQRRDEKREQKGDRHSIALRSIEKGEEGALGVV